jgi:hypothetical protein
MRVDPYQRGQLQHRTEQTGSKKKKEKKKGKEALFRFFVLKAPT